jgi:ATP-dependent Lon protease
MVGFMQPQEEIKPLEDIPRDLPILPLRNTVAFPFMILPLSVGVPRSIKLVEDTLHGNRLIGLVASKDPDLTTVILPRRNERDLDDLPDEVRQSITFVPVDQIDQALEVVLAPAKP